MISPAGTVQLLTECSGTIALSKYPCSAGQDITATLTMESRLGLERGSQPTMGPGCSLNRDPELPGLPELPRCCILNQEQYGVMVEFSN